MSKSDPLEDGIVVPLGRPTLANEFKDVISFRDKKIPFKFQRRQFPLCVCFAMTINKSQG
uniref:Putative P-loop containing nucleoside triphosphate hydrolase n=1 Tax=Helianthus annuus TaxID=4232 RepID=A0A251S214_HELAN